MINGIINLLIILTFQQQQPTVKSAVGIPQRIDILKHELLAQIQNDQILNARPLPSGSAVLDDFYRFVGQPVDDGPIKPITERVATKKHKHRHHIGKGSNIRTGSKQKRRDRLRIGNPPTTSSHTTHTTPIRKTTTKITPADVYLRRFVDYEEVKSQLSGRIAYI